MSEVVVKVSNLSKCYEIYDKPQDRLKQIIFRNKKYYKEFWALKNINFEVNKGESLGIIGRNGSGKSTLLQLICKTLTPTSGIIEIKGKVAALLELGAGFNPQFTGRENVYLSGSILGLKHHEIDKLFDDIAVFADIGDFIDQPVKVYSSGMFVRLAFAVQACIKPDILIIDEALSVGDIFFQQKCARRMQELKENGTTLLFVSHDMGSIRDLCENAIFLKSGELVCAGKSTQVIVKYFADQPNNHMTVSHESEINKPTTKNSAIISQIMNTACWKNTTNYTTAPKAKLIAISVLDENNNPNLKVQMGKKLIFRILYQTVCDEKIHVAILLRNRYNHIVHCTGTYIQNIQIPILKRGEYSIFEYEIDCMLEAGLYTFSAYLSYRLHSTNRGEMIEETPGLGPITITWDYDNDKAPWLGMFGLPGQGRLITVEDTL